MLFFRKKSSFANTANQIVKIMDDSIIVSAIDLSYQVLKDGEEYIPTTIHFEAIETVYFETNTFGIPQIIINNLRIPASTVDIDKLYIFLCKRYFFNIKIIYKHLKDKQNRLYKIYRKTYKKNYSIQQNNNIDYLKGFEILIATCPTFIPWSITVGELLKLPFVKADKYKAHFPSNIRIGNIILPELYADIASLRPEVSVSEFWSNCYAIDGSNNSFHDLKSTLNIDLQNITSLSNRESTDFYSLKATSEFIDITIAFAEDYDQGIPRISSGYTTLSITTKFIYPKLLEDKSYFQKIQITKYIILDYNIGVPNDYETNERVKTTPFVINSLTKSKPSIWKDESNNVLGFSSKNYTQFFHLSEIDYFELENILPAKGGGISYFNVCLKNNKKYNVFTGYHNTLKFKIKVIEEFTNFEIKFYEYYNC